MLAAIYGDKYIDHPKLHNLVKRNNLTDLDFIPGNDEPKLFTDGEYVQLHQSTLRKVFVIAEISRKAWLQELKTNAKWWKVRRLIARAWIESIYEHPLFKVAGILVTLFTLYKIVNATGNL